MEAGPAAGRFHEEPGGLSGWLLLVVLATAALLLFLLRRRVFRDLLPLRPEPPKHTYEQKTRHFHARHSSLTHQLGGPQAGGGPRNTLLADLLEKSSLPLSELAVHTDFPRLARKFRLLLWSRHLAPGSAFRTAYGPLPAQLADAVVLLDASQAEPAADASSDEVMQAILIELARQFALPSVDAIGAQFLPVMRNQARPCRPADQADAASPRLGHGGHQHEHGQRDRSENLQSFLTVVLGEQSPVVKLLKACNQSTIAPAVIRLKVDVGSQHPYKDKRGSWRIDVVFVRSTTTTATGDQPPPQSAASSSEPADAAERADETASSSLAEVVVVHRKRECSWAGETNPESHFEFTWTLQMSFDDKMRLHSVELSISDVYFNPAMPESAQQQVLGLLSSYMLHTRHDSVDSQHSSVDLIRDDRPTIITNDGQP